MQMGPWIMAARPKTLPAAAAPVLVGTAMANYLDSADWLPAIICLGFAILIQVGTNFANDYFDFKKGADTSDRVGPTRAVAAGLIKPNLMKRLTVITFALAFCLGLALIPFGGWWLLLVGVMSILCGYAYTAGPFPLAYVGLGDLFVMLFFGVVAVCCTFFVQTGFFTWEVFILSTAIGGLSTNLLIINNIRDRETDRVANKRTLAVRLSLSYSILEYRFFVVWAYAVVIWMATRYGDFWLTLPLVSLSLAVVNWNRSRTVSSPEVCNKLLAKTALFLVLYATTLSLGLFL